MAINSATRAVELENHIRIVVPDDVEQLSCYVFLEQENWFEEEAAFVAALIQPGDQAVDIGASYGYYTTLMAQRCGAAGHVWAIEPTPATAAALRQTLALNGLDNVTVVEVALGPALGHALLRVHAQSELNAIAAAGDPGSSGIPVTVETLDHLMKEMPLRSVAFVKMDAEGMEAAILEGGRAFFQDHSPCVMIEVRNEQGFHLETVAEFSKLGYQPWRYVPGLNVLCPFAADRADPFLLNLFLLKQATIETLAQRRLVVGHLPAPLPDPPQGA
ncbi:MAG: FkbM family methyltransferase, partial [Proteobacteria bacterium]|nr:FkbM family methyltransferase [Pseudomonadota bacterium]